MAEAGGPALSTEALLSALETKRFGRALRLLAETPSTIDVAWAWLRAGGPEGGAVIAEQQTQGRGRGARSWISPRGGLWMSVLARPGMPAAQGGRLGIGLALAAAEAIARESDCPVGLKWPNDVFLGGRKAGGVLVETETEGGRITGAVLSLGLNVNLAAADLPDEIRAQATSLREMTGRGHDLARIAAEVLGGLEKMWPDLTARGGGLAERWSRWDVLKGEEVEIETGEQALLARAEGIDEEGALIAVVGGEIRRVRVGEVRAVRMAEG